MRKSNSRPSQTCLVAFDLRWASSTCSCHALSVCARAVPCCVLWSPSSCCCCCSLSAAPPGVGTTTRQTCGGACETPATGAENPTAQCVARVLGPLLPSNQAACCCSCMRNITSRSSRSSRQRASATREKRDLLRRQLKRCSRSNRASHPAAFPRRKIDSLEVALEVAAVVRPPARPPSSDEAEEDGAAATTSVESKPNGQT